MISRNLDRKILITSIVFQSETASRTLFPSTTTTPAYIYSKINSVIVSSIQIQLTSQRASPQSNAIANSSTTVVS
jgi:hypothetical protein